MNIIIILLLKYSNGPTYGHNTKPSKAADIYILTSVFKTK